MKKFTERDKHMIINDFLNSEYSLKEISIRENIPYLILKQWLKSYKECSIKGINKTDNKITKKIDELTLKKIEEIYSANKEKPLSYLYKNVIEKLEKNMSFNLFYKALSTLNIFLKNSTYVDINKNTKNGKKYIVKHLTFFNFVNINGELKLPTITLIFNISTLKVINFYISFDKDFYSNFLPFLRESILKGLYFYGISYLPDEILIDTNYNISSKIKKDILDETSIKILQYEFNHKKIDKKIDILKKDLVLNFKTPVQPLKTLIQFLKNYFPISSINIPLQYSINEIENKLNIFLYIFYRKVKISNVLINHICYNHILLKNYNKKLVEVIFDPLNPEQVLIYLDNIFICTACCL